MQKVGTLADFLERNIKQVKTLAKAGLVSTSVITHYEIWSVYKSYMHVPSKMERYQFTAETTGSSLTVVRRVVTKMKQKV